MEKSLINCVTDLFPHCENTPVLREAITEDDDDVLNC